MPSDADGHGSPPWKWVTWALAIGNFVVVSVLGAYVSWQTQSLEDRLSPVQTAAQYIDIVASREAPDYAKSLALSAIFDQGLISRDQLLETAYRIEDDTAERTVVGPLLYQIAGTEELLGLPFGFVDEVTVRRGAAGETPELTVAAWGVDDQGWSIARGPSDHPAMLQIELDNTLRCILPPQPELPCEVTLADRPGVGKIFARYPGAAQSGFTATFPALDDGSGLALLAVRLIDAGGNARTIYSRCVDLGTGGSGRRLREGPWVDGRCRRLD